MKAAAIIVAAGRGRRFGAATPKQFLKLGGRPLFLWSALSFKKIRECRQVVLVVPAGRLKQLAPLARRRGLTLAAGGRERADSVRAGLDALRDDVELVAIHDAARPLVAPALIRKSFAAAKQFGAAVVAVPARDTVKLCAGAFVEKTLPRARVYLAQTPQTFRRRLIEQAYAALGKAAVTDDAQAVERLGRRVAIVIGDCRNFKVTEPFDLAMARICAGGREKRCG